MTDWNQYRSSRFQADPRRAGIWKIISAWLQQSVPEGASVLDLGAGYCDFINNIRAARKVAVDMADVVRLHAAAEVEVHLGSCTRLEFAGDASFDVVFASNLFEHLSMVDVHQTLSEVRRVLKPGGNLMVIQPNFRYCFRQYFDDYTHMTIFTDRSLSDVMVVAGLEPVKVTPRFLPFSVKSRLPTTSCLVWLYLRSPIKPFAGQMFVVARKPQ
jgi:ubiquinone/menaquinone biosynthesis C-methylase UbiE